MDESESTNVAADHPEVVKQLSYLADSARVVLGEFMQRGEGQRPTGSLFPDVAVISNERDWHMLDAETAQAISDERNIRHPDHQRKPKKQKKPKNKKK